MPRTGGEITKAKILETAERLFSEKGFDATSIDSISKSVGINKATIYYHFKDKNDILISLYEGIIEDLNRHLNKEQVSNKSFQEKLKEEIRYLQSKRKLLSILMMEALKDNNTNHALFLCAKSVIKSEMDEALSQKGFDNLHHEQLYNLHEFFTGFIPLVTFIIFQDKWIKLFNGSKKTSVDDFIEIFTKTHLATHLA